MVHGTVTPVGYGTSPKNIAAKEIPTVTSGTIKKGIAIIGFKTSGSPKITGSFTLKIPGRKLSFPRDFRRFDLHLNAMIKARAVWEKTGGIVLADDSGLVVDYLGGEPGVYSARYLGEDTSYEIKNQAIIDRLADAKEEERTARFVSAIAAVLPDGSELVTEGTVEGLIAHEPAGNGGFGYDPIFYLPEYGVTSAEIPIEKKNEISHRGKALEAMKIKLRERL